MSLLPHQAEVRVTMFPDRLTVVDKGEIPGLRSQGLLIEDETPAAAAPKDGKPADTPKENTKP